MDKEEVFKDLKHKHYGIFGSHSAVEICEWNKKALRNEGVCYKQRFYNVDCHRCAQITPAVLWCHQNCIFCWRPAENMKNPEIKEKLNDPKEIIDGLFKEREKLLSGFFGFSGSNKKLLDEAVIPSHVAISLAGEPTIYPHLPEMIKYLKTKKEIKSIFLVSNGQEPKMFKKLEKEKALPTQLYLSIIAPDKEHHKKINRPKINGSWEKLQKSIAIFSKLKTRRVIRFTLIKGINDDPAFAKKYIKLFEKSNADFLEVKSYMYLGESRNNLKIDNMPSFTDVFNYAQLLEKESKLFKIIDDVPQSRIVLMKNKKSKYSKFIK